MQETVNSLNAAVMCGANFVLHAAGWLEGALTVSYEKLVLDADYLGALHVFLRGLPMDDNAFALDAFREVGPGAYFFGCAHTLANYETAFYESSLSDTQSFENWYDDGERDSVVRANAKWKQMLADYEAPPFDVSVDEALMEFMTKKKQSMPDIWH